MIAPPMFNLTELKLSGVMPARETQPIASSIYEARLIRRPILTYWRSSAQRLPSSFKPKVAGSGALLQPEFCIVRPARIWIGFLNDIFYERSHIAGPGEMSNFF